MIGLISNFGGLPKFESISTELEVLAQRVTIIAMKMVTKGDYTIIDRLNIAIVPGVTASLLSQWSYSVIFNQAQSCLVDAYKVLISDAQKAEFPQDSFSNPLLKTRL